MILAHSHYQMIKYNHNKNSFIKIAGKVCIDHSDRWGKLMSCSEKHIKILQNKNQKDNITHIIQESIYIYMSKCIHILRKQKLKDTTY